MSKKTKVSLKDQLIDAFSFAGYVWDNGVEEGMVSFSGPGMSSFGRTRIDGKMYYVADVFCVNCMDRYCLAWDSDDLLSEIECKNCGNKGGLISTGQPFSTIAKRARGLNKGGTTDDGEH